MRKSRRKSSYEWYLFKSFAVRFFLFIPLPLITQNQGTEKQGVGGKRCSIVEQSVRRQSHTHHWNSKTYVGHSFTRFPDSLSGLSHTHTLSLSLCISSLGNDPSSFFSHSCLFRVKSVQYAILVCLVLLERKLQNFHPFPSFTWSNLDSSGRNALWQWRVEVYIEWESECIDDRKREMRFVSIVFELETDSERERERE